MRGLLGHAAQLLQHHSGSTSGCSAMHLAPALAAAASRAPQLGHLAAWHHRGLSSSASSTTSSAPTTHPSTPAAPGAPFSFTAPSIHNLDAPSSSSPSSSSPAPSHPFAIHHAMGPGGPAGPQAFTDVSPPVIISPELCRVVVVGWMGCKKRYLQKYARLWLRSGDHEVMSLRPSIPMTLFRWRGVLKAGTDIDKVARMHIENANMPTIYHIFSTGGFIHAGTMWKWMDTVEDMMMRRSLLDEVKGIIFDSGPAKITEEMGAKAIVSALFNTPADDLASRPVQARVLSAARAGLRWYLAKEHVRLREAEVMEAWYEMAPACPQLYLYSEADPLVRTEDVERFMQIQASRGVAVSSHKWAGSGHCEHYRRHPHDYAFRVSQFVSACLAT